MVTKNGDKSTDAEVATLDGLTEDGLRAIVDFGSVETVAGGTGTNIADVLGTGFSVLDEKKRLCGMELYVVKYGIHKSEKNGGEFTSIHVVTRDGGKWIVNDGGTGIHEQLKGLKEELGTICPLYVARGLRISEYKYTDPTDGKEKEAATFYLNTSK